MVSWTPPYDNGSPVTSYTVTGSPGGRAARHRRPGDHRGRAVPRHLLHLHRGRPQQRRRRARLRAVEPGGADRPAGQPDQRQRLPRRRLGPGQLERAHRPRRGRHVPGLPRHRRAGRGHPVRGGSHHHRDRDRADQRHALHLHGGGLQRLRRQCPLVAFGSGDPGTRRRSATTGQRRSGGTDRGECRDIAASPVAPPRTGSTTPRSAASPFAATHGAYTGLTNGESSTFTVAAALVPLPRGLLADAEGCIDLGPHSAPSSRACCMTYQHRLPSSSTRRAFAVSARIALTGSTSAAAVVDDAHLLAVGALSPELALACFTTAQAQVV